MGILNSLMNGLGKALGEQLYPFYQNAATSYRPDELENMIKDESSKMIQRAVCLLALMRRSPLKALDLYKEKKMPFDNQFNYLYNYPRISSTNR